MFHPNQRHLQGQIFTTMDTLPEHQLSRLQESWAAVFYREFFSRIDEQPYAVLYSAKDSRPNIPVNVLVGLEALKAGFNWSDEELYDAFCFDLQIRFALGYRTLGEGDFTLRTLYNFRHRLSVYMQTTGENLFEQSFEHISDEQIAWFQLKTGKVRMDSSQIASNIHNLSRLHLLVEVIQRVHRMLSEDDRTRFAEAFAPYLKGNAGQYVYRVKGEDGPAHMQRLGELMQHLLVDLAPTYAQQPTYQMLQRVFTEHFLVEVEQERLRLKTGKELRADSLQSPDDPEATFHTKQGRSYKGHVFNVTETCDPENPLQLIAKVQTAPNVTNDDDLLIAAVPSLKERLGVDEVHTDGAYNSVESATVMREHGITHVPTAIRGQAPHQRLGLDKFHLITTDQDGPVHITCPSGQTAAVATVVNKNAMPRYRAYFDTEQCTACPFQDTCLASKLQSKPLRTLSFNQHDIEIARRRQRISQDRQDGRNLRVVIESTIASLKQPFNYDQLPVRGLFRIGMMLLGGAAMANVRRIQRYLTPKRGAEGTSATGAGAGGAEPTLSSRFLRAGNGILRFFTSRQRQSYGY